MSWLRVLDVFPEGTWYYRTFFFFLLFPSAPNDLGNLLMISE